MGDLFHPEVDWQFLDDVFRTIRRNIDHIFIVLTKRPETAWHYIKSRALKGNYLLQTSKNLWLGVSVENQKRADERIPILLQIPAKVRFVSIEPMLGPVDLTDIELTASIRLNALTGGGNIPGLDWVILGGETGPEARPMNPDWVRSVRDQCQEAGVPFFFKQWGEWWQPPSGKTEILKDFNYPLYHHEYGMFKVGKKAAGRELDGRIWEEWPN
jgi:protein gp37